MEENQAEQADQTVDSFDQTVESIVAELNGEPLEAAEATPEPNQAGAEGAQASQVQDESSGQEVPPTSEPKPDTGPDVAARLVQAAQAERLRVAERKQWEEAQAKAVADAKSEVLKALVKDPQGFIKEHELQDLDLLGANFYAAALGEDTPEAIKQKISGGTIEARMRQLEEQNNKLRQEIEQKITQQSQQAEAKAVLAKYQGYLSNVPDDLPYLKATDSNEAIQAMAQVADSIFESEGRMPEAAEVAAMLNKEIAGTLARYQGIQSTNVETTPTPVQATQQESLSLSNQISNKRVTADSLTEDEKIEAAIKDLEQIMRG